MKVIQLLLGCTTFDVTLKLSGAIRDIGLLNLHTINAKNPVLVDNSCVKQEKESKEIKGKCVYY